MWGREGGEVLITDWGDKAEYAPPSQAASWHINFQIECGFSLFVAFFFVLWGVVGRWYRGTGDPSSVRSSTTKQTLQDNHR